MGADHTRSHVSLSLAENIASHNVHDAQDEGDDAGGDDDLPKAETKRGLTCGVFV